MNTQSAFQELLSLILYPEDIYNFRFLGTKYSRLEIELAIKIYPIPEALISIYSCIDIQNDIVFDYQLIPGYCLVPPNRINSLIEMFQGSRDRLILENNAEWYLDFMDWEPDMIPFFEDDGGGYVFIRTLSDDNSIWCQSKGYDRNKIATNLDRLILIAIECYQKGIYYRNEDDVLDVDWELAAGVVKRIDPEINLESYCF